MSPPRLPSRAALDRALVARGGLLEFVRLASPIVFPASPFLENWHHGLICSHLEAVTRGEIRNLRIHISPGCHKSALTNIFWPVWEWIFNPATNWLFASHDLNGLVNRDARRVIQLMQSPWYLERWGSACGLRDKAPAVREFYTLAGGWRVGTTPHGPITGKHPDRIVVDDPTKIPTHGIVEPAELMYVNGWWKDKVQSRGNPKTVARVLIMQRIHADDMSTVFAPDSVNVVLPLEFDLATACATPWGADPRTEPGELMWPAWMGPKEVAERKAAMTAYAYAAQYDQSPVPAGGGMVEAEWFRERWTHAALPEFEELIQSWDTRFKDSAVSGDYVVGNVWGRVGARYYLLDRVRGRWSTAETIDQILALTALWPDAVLKLVEKAASGPSVVNLLQSRVPGLVLTGTGGDSKQARLAATVPLMRAGNVVLPSAEECPWVDDVIASLAGFPFMKFDDDVDAVSQALNHFITSADHFCAAQEVRNLLGF